MKKPYAYLSGGMQYGAKNFWQDKAQSILEKIGYRVFNPQKDGNYLLGLYGIKENSLMTKDHKERDRWVKCISEMATKNLEEIRRADVLIIYWNGKIDKTISAYSEAALFAYKTRKPVLLVLGEGFTRFDLPIWLEVWTSKIFTSFKHLEEFLISGRVSY